MKHLLATALLLLSALVAQAQGADAEVRKIDKAQGRITLKHAGIANLDMPPMTMVFRVSSPGMLDTVAVGDKVRIEARKIDGQYTVTAIRRAP
jgi:Cu/Ag efflux protein CusF